MTSQLSGLDPAAGSLARVAFRLLLLLAATIGLSISTGTVVAVQGGLEAALIVATAWRQWAHHLPVSWAQVGRAVARPLAAALVLTRFHLTATQILDVIITAEILVQLVVQWWRSTAKGAP